MSCLDLLMNFYMESSALYVFLYNQLFQESPILKKSKITPIFCLKHRLGLPSGSREQWKSLLKWKSLDFWRCVLNEVPVSH